MTETIVLTCAKADGWTRAKVEQEKQVQDRVPRSTCVIEDSDDPAGWRLMVTRA
ncbi:hypothetical protein [Sphingomonas adhaesiva]|uniref:hypothetical protein n=1 Tax=Sphingomonas adhaesiva TaxID=28212 RepID=UPI002FF97A9C